MTFSTFIVIWTCLSSTIIVYACHSSPGNAALGVMTQDAQIKEDTKFTISCTLQKFKVNYEGKQVSIDSSNIFFEVDGAIVNSRITNDRNAQIDLPKPRVNDSGTYFCFVQVGPTHVDRLLVCAMDLKVGQPPQKLGKIRCISEHFENLTCSWDPPNYNVETTYTLSEALTGSPCPHRINRTSCQWTSNSRPHYRKYSQKLTLALTSSNIYGNVTELFEVQNFEIILPPPPEKLEITEVTPTSVLLNWDIPTDLDFGPHDSRSPHPLLRFQILQQDAHGDVVEKGGVYIKSFNMTDLIPNTTYRFSVRCKTNQSTSEEFWSQFSNITISTKQDVPYKCPLFLNESYETIVTGDDRRSITLFWSIVDKKHFNSGKLYYEIRYTKTHISRNRREVVEDKTLKLSAETSSYTFDNLSRRSAYSFRIWSMNEIGPSKAFSEAVVDKEDHLPPKPTDIEAFYMGSGRYEIKWKEPTNPQKYSMKHYTLSYCPSDRPQVSKCTGPMRSKRIPFGRTGEPLTLMDHVNYHFALSAVDKYSSSSVIWSTCVVPLTLRKLDKLHKISLTSISPSELSIHWKLPCPGLQAVITKFEIRVCRLVRKEKALTCVDEQLIAINNSRAESFNLSGLKEDSTYRVSMRLWNDSTAGDESEPMEARTGKETEYLIPTIFGFCFFIFGILLISWIYLCCRKFRRGFEEMKQPVVLPGTLGDSSNLTKSVFSQARNIQQNTSASPCDGKYPEETASHSSSDGLINSKHKTSRPMYSVNGQSVYDSGHGTEMMVLKSSPSPDTVIRESCADDNYNTSHDSGIKMNGQMKSNNQNGLNSTFSTKSASQSYVTHEALTKMGTAQTNGFVNSERSHPLVQSSFDSGDGLSGNSDSSLAGSSVPRVRHGYIQISPTSMLVENSLASPSHFVPNDHVAAAAM